MSPVAYRTVDVDGFDVFYREAGATSQPTLLLLHGFPTSSYMFRGLIPLLALETHATKIAAAVAAFLAS